MIVILPLYTKVFRLASPLLWGYSLTQSHQVLLLDQILSYLHLSPVRQKGLMLAEQLLYRVYLKIFN